MGLSEPRAVPARDETAVLQPLVCPIIEWGSAVMHRSGDGCGSGTCRSSPVGPTSRKSSETGKHAVKCFSIKVFVVH
jgi:hypothetical protein